MKSRRRPAEEAEFLLTHFEGHSYQEIQEMFNEKFNQAFTLKNIRDFYNKHGYRKNNNIYTNEQKSWLKNNSHDTPWKEVAAKFYREFNVKLTSTQIRSVCRYYGIRNCRPRSGKAKNIFALEWLKENAEGRKWSEIVNLFNETFHTNKSIDQIKVLCFSNGIRNNRTAKKIWEMHNSRLNSNESILMLDGNRDNISINNMIKITDREHNIIFRKNLRFNNPELTKTGVLIAKLLIKIIERKKELTDGERAVSC